MHWRVLNWLADFSIIAEKHRIFGFQQLYMHPKSEIIELGIWHEYCEPFDAKTTKHLSPRVFVDSFDALFLFLPPIDSVDLLVQYTWCTTVVNAVFFRIWNSNACTVKVLKIYSVLDSLNQCSEIQQDDTCNDGNETKNARDCGCISFKCATSEGTKKNSI